MMTGDLFADQPQAVNDNCLGCGHHHRGEKQVALVDGSIVSNYSESWRRECEARSVLKLPTLEKRQEYLSRIEKFRGRTAADELRDTMLSVWNARQAEKMNARAA